MQIQTAGTGYSGYGSGVDRFARADRNQQVSVRASRRESLDLKLQTADGDTVTLSARALDALKKGGSASAVGLEISIEGNLSADELKDVQQAAKSLLKALHQAQRGNTQGALRSLASIADQDNIASASFHYERQHTISYYA